MPVEPDTIAIMVFTGLMTSGLGALVWARLNHIESRLDLLAAQSVRREELAEFRAEFRTELAELMAEVRTELAELRAEVRTEFASMRSEMAVVRSDLTHIALAVGARKPRASEG